FCLRVMGLLCWGMAFGAMANVKRTAGRQFRLLLGKPWAISLWIALVFPFIYREQSEPLAALTVFIASWIVTALIADIAHRVRNGSSLLNGLQKLSLSYYAMVIAHAGIAVTTVGVGLTSIYTEERDIRMEVGQHVQVVDYEFILEKLEHIDGPNYEAEQATIKVMQDGKFLREMKPEKRRYLASGSTMTEVALDVGLFRDLYVAMGEPLNETAWAMRVHLKPFVRWIWLGALMMAFGAVLAVADKRYRKLAVADQPEPVKAGVLVRE